MRSEVPENAVPSSRSIEGLDALQRGTSSKSIMLAAFDPLTSEVNDSTEGREHEEMARSFWALMLLSVFSLGVQW